MTFEQWQAQHEAFMELTQMAELAEELVDYLAKQKCGRPLAPADCRAVVPSEAYPLNIRATVVCTTFCDACRAWWFANHAANVLVERVRAERVLQLPWRGEEKPTGQLTPEWIEAHKYD